MKQIFVFTAVLAIIQFGCTHRQAPQEVFGFLPQDPGQNQPPQNGLASIQIQGTYFNIEHKVTTNAPLAFTIQKCPADNKPPIYTHNFQAVFVPQPMEGGVAPTRTVEVHFSDPFLLTEEVSYVHVWGTHPGVKTKRLVAINPGSNFYVYVWPTKDWVINIGSGEVHVWVPPNLWETIPTPAPSVKVPKNHYVEVLDGQKAADLEVKPITPGSDVANWLATNPK